jgi:tetratricopeptide (TPR) repeat protein
MNRPFEAKDVFKEVEGLLKEVDKPEARVPLLTRMGYTYGKYLGDLREAKDLLRRAEEEADAISLPVGQIDGLLEVAFISNSLGLDEKTQGLLDRALEQARGQEDARKRADAIANAGTVLTRMDRTDEAQAAFDESQATTKEIADPLSQAYAYLHLSEKLIEAKRKADARTILQTAEASADKVQDVSMRTPLMDKIYAARRLTN